MPDYLTRKIRRVSFYARAVARDVVPRRHYLLKLKKLYAWLGSGEIDPAVASRVNYYNKLSRRFTPGPGAVRNDQIPRKTSYYYYDLKEYIKYFDASLKVEYLFRDVKEVPENPTIVKSRPIRADNENNVLLKLDRLRHFDLYLWNDRTPFRAKRSRVVWRGLPNTSKRAPLIRRHGASTRHDIGYVRRINDTEPKGYLTVQEQLQNRYVLSVEGNDVATNLKWIMASRSLCLMPKPEYETWFMEGQLIAGTHFAEVRPDFEDLDDKIDYFERNPAEAELIIANANRYSMQFRDKAREDLISLLVLQRYFELSGQLPPQPFSTELFGSAATHLNQALHDPV